MIKSGRPIWGNVPFLMRWKWVSENRGRERERAKGHGWWGKGRGLRGVKGRGRGGGGEGFVLSLHGCLRAIFINAKKKMGK